MTKLTQVNARLKPEVHQRLEALAGRTGRTKSFYVAEFTERGLNDLEDYYLAKDALEEHYQADDDPVPADEVDWDNLDRY